MALTFFKNQPELFVGIAPAALFPASGMTISWIGSAKGNVGAAVKMSVIGLVLASVLSPPYLIALGVAMTQFGPGGARCGQGRKPRLGRWQSPER
ncbi:MAG: hypothetical protein QMD76_00885 [Anaerosomatales bacterium]|nr:hypothetical protein [Anaerosomatales bacterium]